MRRRGRKRAAVRAYRRIMARDPVDFPSRQRGETHAAEAICRELQTINPHDAAAAAQFAHILVERMHTRGYHEAEGLLRRALSSGARRTAVLVPLPAARRAGARAGNPAARLGHRGAFADVRRD